MQWRYDDLLTFLQVMETGGITAAAARMNLSKSVVSKRISDLESALGTALFQRSTRQVRPTESGAALHERMVPLIQEINVVTEAMGARQEALRGRFRITTPMSFGTMYLGSVVAAFAKAHPNLELAIDYDDRIVDLVRHGYDLGIRIARLEDSSLIARKLCTSRRMVVCSPEYARQRGLPRNIADLAVHDCIDYAHVHTGQLWQFEGRGARNKVRSVVLRSRIVANNGEAMRDMAIAGLGLVLLPEFLVAEALQSGHLIVALPDETPLPLAIHAVYPRTRHVPAKVRAFIDHLARFFAPPPPWERLAELPTGSHSARVAVRGNAEPDTTKPFRRRAGRASS